MFSENLKVLRKQKGMSQETLAQQLNVVRQTVSKWEKGLSVPDADLLIRIADLFEVSVSELLGERIEEETNTNEVAVQLALLNEQLANRSRRTRKAIKVILVTILAFLLFAIGTAILSVVVFGVNFAPGLEDVVTETTRVVGTMDGQDYSYQVTYDEQGRILSAGGDAFLGDQVRAEDYDNAFELIEKLEEYVSEHGGTSERIESGP